MIVSVQSLEAAAPDTLEERFAKDGRLGAPWSGQGGRFVVENEALRITSQLDNPVCTLDRKFKGDLSFSVRIREVTRSHWLGFVAKGVYWVVLDKQYGTVSLVRREGGKEQVLGEFGRHAPADWSYGTYLWDPEDLVLGLDLMGARLRVTIDGRTFIDARDSAMPAEGGLRLVGGYMTDSFFDDVTVKKAAPLPPPPPAAAPLSFRVASAACDHTDNVYHDGERATVTLGLEPSAGGTPRTVDLGFSVLDLDSRTIMAETRSVSLVGIVTEKVVVTPPRRGVFKVRVSEGAGFTDAVSFSVLPRRLGEAKLDERSPFGGHTWAQKPDLHMALARKMGMRWTRGVDFMQYAWWDRVEEEKGVFTFFDPEIDRLRANELHHLGSFLHTPYWASSAPGNPAKGTRLGSSNYPPRDPGDFENYVYRTVSQYRRHVRHWEIWNEPHYHGFWTGTPESYADLSRRAYHQAKRADPGCVVVVGGGISPKEKDWIARAFAAGLSSSMDALSVHTYGGAPIAAEVESFEQDIASIRAHMRSNGREVPIWHSEVPVFSTSFLDDKRSGWDELDAPYHYREGASRIVRIFVSNLAVGIEKVFLYYMREVQGEAEVKDRPITQNLLDLGGGLKPAGVAFATCSDVLGGLHFDRRIDLTRETRIHLFEGEGDAVAVYWANVGGAPFRKTLEGAAAPFKLETVDLMNNAADLPASGTIRLPLSRDPVIVRARGVDAHRLAAWFQQVRQAP